MKNAECVQVNVREGGERKDWELREESEKERSGRLCVEKIFFLSLPALQSLSLTLFMSMSAPKTPSQKNPIQHQNVPAWLGKVWPHSHKDWRYGRVVRGGSSMTGVGPVHVLVGGLALLSVPFLFLVFSDFGRCAVHPTSHVFPTWALRDLLAYIGGDRVCLSNSELTGG